jgi:hypothetical protein
MLTTCLQRQAETSALYSWKTYQRQQHRDGKLDDDKYERLSALGFCWHIEAPKPTATRPKNCVNLYEARWDTKFEALRDFKDRHGHLNLNKVCSADNVV